MAAERATPVKVLRTGASPSATPATGVSGARPPAISASAIAGIVATPIRTTMVAPTAASASQSTVDAGSPGRTWPDTTVKA